MAFNRKLGDLFIEIRARGMSRVRAGLVGLRMATQKLAMGLRRTSVFMGRWARRMGLVVGAGLVYGIKKAVDFEKQMAFVSTMLERKAMPMMEKFGTAIRRMSVEFGQSADDLARGLYDILSAVIAPTKALGVLREATKSAIAGFTDAATATRAMIALMKSYGIAAEQAGDVADWMFAVVKRGVLTYEQLANSVGRASATAAIAGLKFNEFGASISTMTRAGLGAEMTMTAIVGILRAFMRPTSDGAKLAKKFGFELKTNTLRTIGLTGVLQKLHGATAEQIAQIFPTIRGLRGLAAALKNMGEFTEDVAIQLNKAGLRNEAFAKAAATTSFQLRRLWMAFQEVARSIGQTMLPAVRKLTDGLITLFMKISAWVESNKAALTAWASTIADAFEKPLKAGRMLLGFMKALAKDLWDIVEWLMGKSLKAIELGLNAIHDMVNNLITKTTSTSQRIIYDSIKATLAGAGTLLRRASEKMVGDLDKVGSHTRKFFETMKVEAKGAGKAIADGLTGAAAQAADKLGGLADAIREIRYEMTDLLGPWRKAWVESLGITPAQPASAGAGRFGTVPAGGGRVAGGAFTGGMYEPSIAIYKRNSAQQLQRVDKTNRILVKIREGIDTLDEHFLRGSAAEYQ